MGRVGRRESRRLLDAAFEEGIDYFDTARAYGWGESEYIVGEFLRGKRDRVTLATKFGILPPARQKLLHSLKPFARMVLNAVKAIAGGAAQGAMRRRMATSVAQGVSYGNFTPQRAMQSLEQSLHALGTDCVDILHLHEPQLADITPELLRFLEEQRDAGKFRYVGLAGDVQVINQVLSMTSWPWILQTDFRTSFPLREKLWAAREHATIVHSVFGHGATLARVAELVQSGKVICEGASALGFDLSKSAEVARLLLLQAILANPEGVVLCGMNSMNSVRANAKAVQGIETADSAGILRAASELGANLLKVVS